MGWEGTSRARSAGPCCVAPGHGFPRGCPSWLVSVWGAGHKERAGRERVLACLRALVDAAAAETWSSPEASGGRRPLTPGLGNHVGVPSFFDLNEFCVSWG